jgi:translation initiation factor 2 beta subunit (eIF-2beta)/eIF-5
MHDCKVDYTYKDMLHHAMGILRMQNPDLIKKECCTMKLPQLTQVLTKKTLWVNFQEICTMMQRSPQHLFQFFMAKLGAKGSIAGNQQLVIQGKYVPKYIKSLLRKYIVSYVTCKNVPLPQHGTCKGPLHTAQLLQVPQLQQQQEHCAHQQQVPCNEPHQQEGGKECSRIRGRRWGGGGGEWMRATFSPALVCCIIGGPVFFGGFLDNLLFRSVTNI